MPFPDLPPSVKSMLANERHRTHHHLWHFVRNEESWNNLPDSNRAELRNAGWEPRRFDQQPGSGIDFLGMHRQMIEMVNRALEATSSVDWPKVVGWALIPSDEDDDQWPVPSWQIEAPPWASDAQWETFTALAKRARSSERLAEMQKIAARFKDKEYLKTLSLDELGIQMEWSVHGWMHMRWSGAPYNDGFSVDPENDWLFVPWSSHVNRVFWKLHGWIDERIDDWQSANNQPADLSDAWVGPPAIPGVMPHMAEVRLLNHLPAKEDKPMPMLVREHIVEGLLK